jgi:hypothetical protein
MKLKCGNFLREAANYEVKQELEVVKGSSDFLVVVSDQ